jgi:hypothetical protein
MTKRKTRSFALLRMTEREVQDDRRGFRISVLPRCHSGAGGDEESPVRILQR